MRMFKPGCAIAAVLALAPVSVFAQDAVEEDAGSQFAFSAALTNDYVWRGVSQTDESLAFQSGLTYTSPVGVYATVWGSNVDFGEGSDADFEVDGIIGYNVDFSDNVNFDISVIRYMYPGASELSWNELDTKTTFLGSYSVVLNYSDDVWASGESGLYYGVGGSWELPADFGLAASVNRTDFGSDVGLEDYTDWSVSLSKSVGPAALSLAYVGTDGNGRDQFGQLADDRLVATISVAVP